CSGMRPGSSPSDSSPPPSPPSRRLWTFRAGPCVLRKQLASWRALPGVGRPPRFDGPMPTLDTLPNRFARCVSLFRDASAKSDQKKEFRDLLRVLQAPPFTNRPAHGASRTQLNGEAWRDIKSVPLQGVPMVTHDPPPPPAADALPGVADRASRPGKTGADELLSLSSERHPAPASPGAVPPPPPPSAPPPSPSPEPGPPAAAEHHPAPAARVALPPGAAEVLAELERNSTAPNVGDLLAALIDHAATAA